MKNKINKFLILIIFILSIALVKTNWAMIEYSYNLFQWKVLHKPNPDFETLFEKRLKMTSQRREIMQLARHTIEEEKKKITIFLKRDMTLESIDNITQKLLKTKRIAYIEYRSQEEALNIYKERKPGIAADISLTADIFPPSLDIIVYKIEDVTYIDNMFKNNPEIDTIFKNKDSLEDSLQNILNKK